MIALLVSIPPSVSNELTATLPYSETLKEDFEKKSGELIKQMKEMGCIRGTVSAEADEEMKVIHINVRCLEWGKELSRGLH